MNLLLLLSFFLLSHTSKIFCFAVDYYDYIVIMHSLIVHICSSLCMGGNGSAFAECRRLIEVHAYLKRKSCMCICTGRCIIYTQWSIHVRYQLDIYLLLVIEITVVKEKYYTNHDTSKWIRKGMPKRYHGSVGYDLRYTPYHNSTIHQHFEILIVDNIESLKIFCKIR